MELLEILYAREFKKVTYNVRKLSFEATKILLLGPHGCGKTTMIYDYLYHQEKGSFLYIDFSDFRVYGYDVENDLANFIAKKHIKLLVLDNFDFSFELPKCEEMIITSTKDKNLDGFVTQTLYPLDFEEFISFDKRELNLESIFSSYASIGTFPAIFAEQKIDFIKVYQNFLRVFVKDDVEMSILKLFASHQAKVVSIHTLYQELKVNMKISKDRFYSYAKKLEEEKVIFFIEKFGQSRGSKKIYLIDFAIRSALSFEKDFIKRFENIIFLELLKREKKVFYTEAFDFYIQEESRAILSIPFLPQNIIENKLERLNKHFIEFDIKSVQVVTMEVEKVYEIDGIRYELIPFIRFAISF